MKKKLIIISVMILFVGIIWGVSFVYKDKKSDIKEINMVPSYKKEKFKEEKKTFYVESIPKVDQEYTILYEYDISVLPVSTKEETVSDDSTISGDNEAIIEENKYVQNDNDIEKEISGILSEENIKETKEEEAINSDSSLLTENDKEMMDEELVKINEDIKKDDDIPSENLDNEKVPIQNDIVNLKNGFYEENGKTYYYENDIKITGLKSINGVNNYFSPSGKHLGTNNIKVIDVSYYQKDINWDLFVSDSDCYGVILRLGYYETLDKKFERNINELKRLNIPYGIYLFSYASTLNGAKKEADFTNKMITKYDINPTLGIYYDIEGWSTKTSNSNNISKTMYDNIIQHYINSVSYYTNYKYKVKVYSGRWYAMNRLGNISKKYVDWVAEYNKTCKYDDIYSMWQYTSKGSVPGIEGNVDISYIL